MFFLTGTLSYMVTSVMKFSNEIAALQIGDLQSRTIAAAILSSFLLIGVFFFRLTYGCEEFGTMLLSMIVGLVAGVFLMYQNDILFGRAGINILNLPMILTPSESGNSSMYVCGPAK